MQSNKFSGLTDIIISAQAAMRAHTQQVSLESNVYTLNEEGLINNKQC